MYSNKMEKVEHRTLAAKIDFEWSVFENRTIRKNNFKL
jgi:hypothetical protein